MCGQMAGISHVMSKNDVLALLAETGRQRHAAARSQSALVPGQRAAVMALLSAMDPESYSSAPESVAAVLPLKGTRDAGHRARCDVMFGAG